MAVGRGRITECPPVPAASMQGSMSSIGSGDVDAAIRLPTVGFENPGATPDLRGVEPNTGGQDAPGNFVLLEDQQGSFSEFGETYPGGMPSDVPEGGFTTSSGGASY